MQYINRIISLGHVDHPPFALNPYTDFVDANTNSKHGLKVGWHAPSLNGIKLKSCFTTHIGREIPQFTQTVAYETQGLHRNYIKVL